MSRRKSEITGHMNERNFPHLVELELPALGYPHLSKKFPFSAPTTRTVTVPQWELGYREIVSARKNRCIWAIFRLFEIRPRPCADFSGRWAKLRL
jgi:hypothetical protein